MYAQDIRCMLDPLLLGELFQHFQLSRPNWESGDSNNTGANIVQSNQSDQRQEQSEKEHRQTITSEDSPTFTFRMLHYVAL